MGTDRSSKKLKFNIISSGIYQILVMVVPILTTPYVTRIFNVSQIGEYNLSLTIAALFVVFSQFGIETFGSREIARSKTEGKKNVNFFELFSIQFVASICMFVLYNIIFVFILNLGNKQLYFVQSLLILVNVLDISWFFIGIEEISKTIGRNVITKFFTTLVIFAFIKNDDQLSFYALINVLGMLLGNFTMIISSKKYINYNYRMFSINKRYVKGSFKLLIPRLLNTSYGSAEKSILTFYTTLSNVGVYSEGQKIINLAFSVINSGFNALTPRMTYHVSRKEYDKVNDYLLKGLKYVNFFSIIVVSGIFAISTDFVDFFYGAGYQMVAIVLKITGVALLFIPITVLLTQGLLVPIGKDKEYSISIIVILISGIILNILLDPQLGARGAAISYLCAQLLCFIYVIVTVRKFIDSLKIFSNILISVVAVLINRLIIDIISEIIIIDNPFFSFLFFGVISVIISVGAILILMLIDSKKIKEDN